jgi:hypothetical protein
MRSASWLDEIGCGEPACELERVTHVQSDERRLPALADSDAEVVDGLRERTAAEVAAALRAGPSAHRPSTRLPPAKPSITSSRPGPHSLRGPTGRGVGLLGPLLARRPSTAGALSRTTRAGCSARLAELRAGVPRLWTPRAQLAVGVCVRSRSERIAVTRRGRLLQPRPGGDGWSCEHAGSPRPR